MPNNLIPDELLQHLLARVDDETAVRLNTEVVPTPLLALDAVDTDLSAQAFHRAFVLPLEVPAQRAGLFLAVVVAEPVAGDGQLLAGKPRRLTVLPRAEGARRVLRGVLRDFAERT